MRIVLGILIVLSWTILSLANEDKEDGRKPTAVTETAVKGKFKAKLVRANPCEHPTLPYFKDRDQYNIVHGEVYNNSQHHSMFRGNLTFLKPLMYRKLGRLKGFTWKNNRWQIQYLFDQIACDGILTKALVKAAGLKYKNGCNFAKGTFNISVNDFNKVEHLFWPGDREYGRSKWMFESYFKLGTLICWEMETVITPA